MADEKRLTRYERAIQNFDAEDSEIVTRDRVSNGFVCPECGELNSVTGVEQRKVNTVRVDVACNTPGCGFEEHRAGVTEEARKEADK